MKSSDLRTNGPTSPTAVKPPVIGPDDPPIISSEVFVSDVKTPLSHEQYIERVEAVLKLLGLPPLAEVNRMEAEAEAAASKKATKPRR
jgi:hypothetical protein